MKRRVKPVLSSAVTIVALSVLIPQASAWSADARGSAVAQVAPGASGPTRTEVADRVSLPKSELRMKAVKRYVHNIGILERMIFERLTLSSEQREAAENRFKDHVAAARANDGAKDRWRDRNSATEKPKDLRQLREEWKKKMADGTAPAIPRAHIFEHPAEFLVALSFKINEDQLDKYDAVVKRWMVLRPGVGGDGPIRHILRAVKDIELPILGPLRMEIRSHVLAEMRKIGSDRKDPKKVAAFCAKMREYVLSKLTTEQQSHFTKTLDQIGKDAAHFKAGE